MYNISPNIYNFWLMEESAEYGINMPHDRLFKDILNEKEEFCDFINRFVNKGKKEKLLPQDIEKATTSFITPIFKNRESDILYKKVNEDKYYLVEHQSTIDDSMSFRMLNYCVNILNNVIERNKLRNREYKIPKIIPIVLYTGERKWNSSRKLTDKQEDLDNEGTLIELEYNLIDINSIEEESLFRANTSLSYGLLIEKNKGKDKLIKVLNKIANNCDSEVKEIKMKRIIKYILEPTIGEEETKEMLEKFNKMGGEEVMTAIDCLLRDIEEEKQQARIIGKEEGKAEGRLKGMVEGKEMGMKIGIKEGIKEGTKNTSISIAKEMLRIGMDIERISQITKLDKEEIRKIEL